MTIKISKLKRVMIWKSPKLKTDFRRGDYWFLRLPFGIIVHYYKLPF